MTGELCVMVLQGEDQTSCISPAELVWVRVRDEDISRTEATRLREGLACTVADFYSSLCAVLEPRSGGKIGAKTATE